MAEHSILVVVLALVVPFLDGVVVHRDEEDHGVQLVIGEDDALACEVHTDSDRVQVVPLADHCDADPDDVVVVLVVQDDHDYSWKDDDQDVQEEVEYRDQASEQGVHDGPQGVAWHQDDEEVECDHR